VKLIPTGEMTLGPFFPREFAQDAADLTLGGGAGVVIEVTGRVTQADGRPLDNLVVEIWQPDADGRYDNPEFYGWGRAATDADGVYRFRTLKPAVFRADAPAADDAVLRARVRCGPRRSPSRSPEIAGGQQGGHRL
jgi:protocatechuate 3,4-dioxygenase alpha subunit